MRRAGRREGAAARAYRKRGADEAGVPLSSTCTAQPFVRAPSDKKEVQERFSLGKFTASLLPLCFFHSFALGEL